MPNIHVVIKQKKDRSINFNKHFNRLNKIIKSKNKTISLLGLEIKKIKNIVNRPNVRKSESNSALKRVLDQNNKNVFNVLKNTSNIKRFNPRVSVNNSIKDKLALPNITIINKGTSAPFAA